MLIHATVNTTLQFLPVDGNYVLKDGRISKVPVPESEISGTNLLGFFEKRRFKQFLQFARNYNPNDPETHEGISPTTPSEELMHKFKFTQGIIDMVGHTMALYSDESWLKEPSVTTISRIVSYLESFSSIMKSPYYFPVYGLGEFPQVFSSRLALYGGKTMLNRPVLGFTFDVDGRVSGVKFEGGLVTCKTVVGDPSYFTERVKKVSSVARCYAILDHPITQSDSCHITLPQNQLKRQSDIHITCLSSTFRLAPKGKYLCVVSSTMETDDPKTDLQSGVNLLEPVLFKTYSVSPLYEPINDHTKEGIHISKSYDATTHSETLVDDIIRLYKEITGESDVSYIYTNTKGLDL